MILIMLLNLILATIKMMMKIKKDFGIYLKNEKKSNNYWYKRITT